MRYFSYNEPNSDGTVNTITKSEKEIREEYYPYWIEKMNKKFGKEHVLKTYSFENCLEDWKTIHWAWEFK